LSWFKNSAYNDYVVEITKITIEKEKNYIYKLIFNPNSMKIWIDLTNSPHVLFFEPIIENLREKGHKVKIIVKNHAQTTQLLDFFGMKYDIIGKTYTGKNIVKKLLKISI